MTQCERVLRHLRDYGTISQLEAMGEYGIMRLASRISDLKREGHHIGGHYKTIKNRYGESVSYKVYELEEEE